MALGTSVDMICRPDAHGSRVYPVGLQTDWQTSTPLISDLSTADNSGNSILDPAASGRATERPHKVNGRGTTLLVCVKYDDGHTAIVTSPVIQLFGKDKNGVYHKLKNAAATHELTLTCAPITDVTDGTWRYSDAVEVDLDGSMEVVGLVKTAFNGDGTDALSYLIAKTL
jgi:hypothetical protein